IARQLLRSATAVSAHYRAARRGRTKKEFAAKGGIVVEEADAPTHRLELIIDAQLLPRPRVAPLPEEAEKRTRLFAKTRRPATRHPRRPPPHDADNISD